MSWILGEPYIEITSKCNLKCKYCYNESCIEKCFSYFESKGVEIVSISGGEPLVHKDIFKILKSCKSHGFKVLLATNGTLITDKIAKDLVGLVDKIQISIDGNREMHDNIRGEGSFDKSVEGIRNLCNNGLKDITRLRMCISRENMHTIDDVCDLAMHFKLESLQFSVVRNMGRASDAFDDKFMFTDSMLLDIHYKVESLFEKNKDKINIGKLGVDGGTCTLLKENASVKPRIMSSGKVFTCHGFEAEEFSLGNIHDTSLDEILSNDKIQMFIDKLSQARKDIEKCKHCMLSKSLCSGGCPAQVYELRKTLNDIDGLCNVRKQIWYNKILKKQLHK